MKYPVTNEYDGANSYHINIEEQGCRSDFVKVCEKQAQHRQVAGATAKAYRTIKQSYEKENHW